MREPSMRNKKEQALASAPTAIPIRRPLLCTTWMLLFSARPIRCWLRRQSGDGKEYACRSIWRARLRWVVLLSTLMKRIRRFIGLRLNVTEWTNASPPLWNAHNDRGGADADEEKSVLSNIHEEKIMKSLDGNKMDCLFQLWCYAFSSNHAVLWSWKTDPRRSIQTSIVAVYLSELARQCQHQPITWWSVFFAPNLFFGEREGLERSSRNPCRNSERARKAERRKTRRSVVACGVLTSGDRWNGVAFWRPPIGVTERSLKNQ